MKSGEKKFLVILVLVAIVIIGTIYFVTINKNKEKANENEISEEGYVNVLEDGTKVNTSTKLAETKIVDDLEISNFKLTQDNVNGTVLIGTIRNNTSVRKESFPAEVALLDKNGGTIVVLQALFPSMEPGDEKELNVSATLDYVEAYDITIVKK